MIGTLITMDNLGKNSRFLNLAQGGVSTLCAFFILAYSEQARGSLDLDGNGASELWELLYLNGGSPLEDSDGDGFSDFNEMIAGTNPLLASDRFQLEQPLETDGEIVLQWQGVAGKSYRLEEYEASSSEWIPVVLFDTKEVSGLCTYRQELSSASRVYRMAVEDVDFDQDGLSAWEEDLLGWSDEDAFSSSEDGISDYENAIITIEQVEGTTLANGQVLPQRLPGAAEAARFLVQSSFGPTPETIDDVMEMGMSGWVQDQIEIPMSSTRVNMLQSGIAPSAIWWRHGWWRTVLMSDDQLRQRLAYALSQILVINNEPGTVIGDNALTKAIYFDQIVDGSFGSYRKILEDVTYSPVMGFYLSHLNNRKSDPVIGRFPDENFAREIMQLFTIGLWELEVTGERMVTESGDFIPTYDNETIRNMAKIFTGMSHSRSRGQIAESFYDTANGNDYGFPMQVWEEEHEGGVKVLFQDVVIPDGLTGEEDVQQTLDALTEHPNIAPFIGRLLIQRFTSSNPSPQYISRVSAVWNTSGGNLGKVIRAILFDPEARRVGLNVESAGKVREPLLRLTHLLRAFGSPETSGSFGVLASSLNRDLGQFVMSSPSVFNFYLPDHSPAGELRENGLFAPELELATSSALLDTYNRFAVSIVGHFGLQMNYDDELLIADDVDELLDHLNVLLSFGEMSDSLRATIRAEVETVRNPLTRVYDAVRYIITSPNFTVLK